MNKKIILFLLFSFLTINSSKASDVTNAVSTTVALAGGIATGYLSKEIFYENPNSQSSIRVAKDWIRNLCHGFKDIVNQKKSTLPPYGKEMENYILALRCLTGLLVFTIIKSIY